MSDFDRIDEPMMHEEPGLVARHPLAVVLLVGAVALTLRVIALQQLAATPMWESRPVDLGYYHDWALRLLDGTAPEQVFEQSPLYAWFLAAVYKVFGTGPLVPRAIQILLGSLTCALVCGIARRLLTPGAGLAAGLMAAAYGPFLFYDTMLMKESLGVFLFTLALWQLAASEGWKTGLLALAGVTLGLAALVRDNLILLAPVVLVWIVFSAMAGPARLHRVRPRHDVAYSLSSFAAGILLVVIPIAARNHHVSDEWVLLTAGGGEVFYIGNNPSADGYYSPPPFVRPESSVEHEDFRVEAARRLGRPAGSISRKESSNYWLRAGLGWIRSHPGDWASLMARKLRIFWNHYELPDNQSYAHHRRLVPILRWPLLTFGLLAPLALAGILLSASWWRTLLLPSIVGTGYLMAVILFFNFGRFRMPMIPVLLVFAAGAISGALSCIARRRYVLVTAGAGLFVLAWVFCNADLEEDPLHTGQNHGQLAELLLAAGRVGEAHDESAAAIATLEGAWVGLGGKLGEGGHGLPPEAAVPHGLNPAFTEILEEAYATHATILRRLGRLEEASAWEKRAGIKTPAGPTGMTAGSTSLVREGRILEEQGQYREAAAAFRKALEQAGPSAGPVTRLWITLNLAHALHRAGESKAALSIVEKALEEAGDAAPPAQRAAAHYGQALIYRDLENEESMRFHMGECLRLDPQHPRAAWMNEILAQKPKSPSPPGK